MVQRRLVFCQFFLICEIRIFNEYFFDDEILFFRERLDFYLFSKRNGSAVAVDTRRVLRFIILRAYTYFCISIHIPKQGLLLFSSS
jgi:hypothetical protein